MSVDSSGNAKEIFLSAIEIESQREREAYLADACGDDRDLRQRVDALIQAHESPESLLNTNAPAFDSEGVSSTIDYQNPEQAGSQIGPYKLRERLGMGGMGIVWAAERKEPIRQKVALKVIKPGMDSEQILARFEAEKHALSLMNHPNIARVLDAGTTEQGRPFFAMELIRGVPITEYCDAKKLIIQERLKLFTQACKAVQHAHQKGIIHRDIKPSNVLVSEQDGEPVVKVIDFGVSKALQGYSSDHSVYSGLFQAIGTLAYMSPEQAGLSTSDIDTRADIYSLGVLLYELLTGQTPFEKEQLASAALAEACRIIRETDPLRPSTRISQTGEKSRSISLHRNTDASGLYRLVRGDLDWIVMKCLDKDRTKRYETPSTLADDILRFLRDEEVSARAPSSFVRFRKLLRRNRAAATVLLFAFLSLLVISFFGWSSYLNLRSKNAADRLARIPLLADSARQREESLDFTKAAEFYEELIDLESATADDSNLARHRAQFARCLSKLDRFGPAEESFVIGIDLLDSITSDHKKKATARLTQTLIIECAEDVLAKPKPSEEEMAISLRLAQIAFGLSTHTSESPPPSAYTVLARSQYENKLYRDAISTCLNWLATYTDGYSAYLILSGSQAHLGNSNWAKDWWLVADNYWVAANVEDRLESKSLQQEVEAFLASANVAWPPEDLSIEQELLYARVLDHYPDLRGLRKYRGYCLFQLGRWRESKEEFDFLMRQQPADAYILSSSALIDLFFDQSAVDVERQTLLKNRALELNWYHPSGALVIPMLLADSEGSLANEELYEHLSGGHVASAFVLYRMKRYDEAYNTLLTHGGVFPARDAIAEILLAMIRWRRGDEVEARNGLRRAEELISRLSPREGAPKTNDNIGFATSLIWLEPMLLLREARKEIARAPSEQPSPVDSALYPLSTFEPATPKLPLVAKGRN